MQTQSRILDDLARLATGAAGSVLGVRDEMRAQMRDRIEQMLAGWDLVSRDEFETIREVAVRAREAQETLEARVAALEAKLADLESAKTGSGKSTAGTRSRSATAKRPAAKTKA